MQQIGPVLADPLLQSGDAAGQLGPLVLQSGNDMRFGHNPYPPEKMGLCSSCRGYLASRSGWRLIHKTANWSAYNEALRQRGSLTVWFTDDAIAAWKAAPRTTPGGQPHYSDLAITTALTLRAVFHLALRQTVIGSVLQLLGLDLSVPDFSTLSRRAQSLELPAQPRATGGAIHLLVDSSGLKLGGPGE